MESARTRPSTRINRLGEKQSESRERLYELLDSTPLATVALVRDGHPVAFPTGFARIADELVIHGSTGLAVAAGADRWCVGGRVRHRARRSRRRAQRIRVVLSLPQRGCVWPVRARPRRTRNSITSRP